MHQTFYITMLGLVRVKRFAHNLKNLVLLQVLGGALDGDQIPRFDF